MAVSRDELLELIHLAEQAHRLGKEVDWPEIEREETDFFHSQLLRATRGEVTAKEIVEIVDFYWPNLSETQEFSLDEWQARLCMHLISGMHTDLNEAFIKGCTGPGKGRVVATVACLWIAAGRDLQSCKIIVTSNTAQHAKKTMMAEIASLYRKMRHAPRARVGVTQINLVKKDGSNDDQKFVAVVNPAETEAFSGQHSEATLVIFDEASATDEEYWHQSQTMAAMRIALSNPRPGSTYFRRGFPAASPNANQIVDCVGGRRLCWTVSGEDCANVRLGRQAIPAQLNRSRYEAIIARKHPPWWADVMGRGRFTDEDDARLLVLPGWLDRHHRAWHDKLPVECFALDVAASEYGDRSVLACGASSGCAAIHELQTANTMQVVSWVLKQAHATYGIDLASGENPIVVDMDGVGKGVGDRLDELGCWVIEFRGNATSEVDSKLYGNLRAEAYGELSLRLKPDGTHPDDPWPMPLDEELDEELCAPERIWDSGGHWFRITPKYDRRRPGQKLTVEPLVKTLGHSPDKADAVVYLYHGVRHVAKNVKWRQRIGEKYLTSVGSGPMTDDELRELPDYLRDIVESSKPEQ